MVVCLRSGREEEGDGGTEAPSATFPPATARPSPCSRVTTLARQLHTHSSHGVLRARPDPLRLCPWQRQSPFPVGNPLRALPHRAALGPGCLSSTYLVILSKSMWNVHVVPNAKGTGAQGAPSLHPPSPGARLPSTAVSCICHSIAGSGLLFLLLGAQEKR